MTFSASDIDQISSKGLSVEKVMEQLEIFRKGLPPVHIESAATVGNGILRLSEKELLSYSRLYDEQKSGLDIGKFVPASGQATRMFKFLFQFLKRFQQGENDIDDFLKSSEFPLLKSFNADKEKLPFYTQLLEGLGDSGMGQNGDLFDLINYMLHPEGMNLGGMPKGLIPFHRYKDNTRTAFEEHLHEGLTYLRNSDRLKVHFTVSPDHRSLFESRLEEIRPGFEVKFGCQLEITFSEQDPSTDTIAVNPDNTPFREDNGKLVFRPSGHGALLHNLDALKLDLVFLRNIDNVAIEQFNKEIIIYRRALAGLLIDKKNKAFEILDRLDKMDHDSDTLKTLFDIASKELNISPTDTVETMPGKDQINWLRAELNRPIRVCGMVKNEGQPGGGPFWVKEGDGSVSLQIVELVQIDRDNPAQADILSQATHFNPVDVVCWLTDWNGNSFDLLNFSDPDSAFISKKTHMGKPLKALEMPGLWNGGMANWITVFVEVPLKTFNPVKTVNDLFNPMHSAG